MKGLLPPPSELGGAWAFKQHPSHGIDPTEQGAQNLDQVEEPSIGSYAPGKTAGAGSGEGRAESSRKRGVD